MPMYEFHCPKCDKVFEELAFGDETVPCPDCGCKETERLISACCHMSGGRSDAGASASGAHSSGCSCSSCSGGHCATCGH